MELLKSNVVTAFENTATYFYFPKSTESGLDADDSFVVCHIHAVNVYIHEYRYLRKVNKKISSLKEETYMGLTSDKNAIYIFDIADVENSEKFSVLIVFWFQCWLTRY